MARRLPTAIRQNSTTQDGNCLLSFSILMSTSPGFVSTACLDPLVDRLAIRAASSVEEERIGISGSGLDLSELCDATLRGMFAGTASLRISPNPEALLRASFCTRSNSSAGSAGFTPITPSSCASEPLWAVLSVTSRTKPSNGLVDFPKGTRTRDPGRTESRSSMGIS